MMFFIVAVTVFLHCMRHSEAAVELSDNIEDKDKPKNDDDIRTMLGQVLHNYDRRLRPNYLGPAVDVDVEASVMTISKIDEVNMMYTVDMFFRQRWNDPRLKHPLGETLTLIVGRKHPSDIIWVPDTVFIDSIKSNMHGVTVNNHKVDIAPNGDVLWGTRVTVSPSCAFDLRNYPMDKQRCHFVILSYAYTSRHLKYKWINKGIVFFNIKMAQFVLTSHRNITEEISYAAGEFTQLVGVLYLSRQLGYAIMKIYTPSICVVMVSYLSLYVQRSSIPARIGLCITTLLTISSFWSSVNAQLPRVNYVKSIDIFMLTCFTTVILTLVEFILVLNSSALLNVFRYVKLERRKIETKMPKYSTPKYSTSKDRKNKEVRKGERSAVTYYRNNASQFSLRRIPLNMLTINEIMDYDVTDDQGKSRNDVSEVNEENHTKKEVDELAEKIDGYARLFFPVCYGSFLLIYFIFYLRRQKDMYSGDEF